MGQLDGKTAVITGAANGIGLAVAERFVGEGARLLLVDLNEAALREASARLGPNVSFHIADVSEGGPPIAIAGRPSSNTARSTSPS